MSKSRSYFLAPPPSLECLDCVHQDSDLVLKLEVMFHSQQHDLLMVPGWVSLEDRTHIPAMFGSITVTEGIEVKLDLTVYSVLIGGRGGLGLEMVIGLANDSESAVVETGRLVYRGLEVDG